MVKLEIIERTDQCSECNKHIELAWVLEDGTVYGQECLKKLFTKRSTLNEVRFAFAGERVLWLLLDDKQSIRLVCSQIDTEEGVAYIGLLGEGTEHQPYGQKRFPNKREARRYTMELLGRYMLKKGFKRISMMSTNYKDVAA